MRTSSSDIILFESLDIQWIFAWVFQISFVLFYSGCQNPFGRRWLDIDIDVDKTYRQAYNIIHTPVGKRIVDHSDVVGASPVGVAPTTSSFST